jgi:Putative peptidoglycan binding domain
MERKQLLSISASVLAAAWMASDAGSVLAQSSGERKSFGGTQSERTQDSGTPLPEKSPMTGTDKSSGSSRGNATSQSGTKDNKTINPDVNQSVGGSQSERTGDSGTPLPKKSPSTGTVERGSQAAPGAGQSGMRDSKPVQPDISSPNTSTGGTQSQRTGDSGTPLPEGSRMGGTVDPTPGSGRRAGTQDAQGMRQSGDSSGRSGMAGERWAMEDIKEAQEALKDKGHDPGSIDGRMGPKTREAIRAFQSSNGLRATGSLNAETAKKLGVEREGSSGSSRGSMDKDRSGSSSMPKDSTKRDSSAR